MFPRGWLIPELRSEFKDVNLFKENNTEVIRMTNDDKKMEICLDTSQYKPSELKVQVNKETISVEGKHEEKAEDGSRMVARQFVRRYTLPEGARSEDVVSNLSTDGVLVITAKKSPIVDRFVEISNTDTSANTQMNVDDRESSAFKTVSKEEKKKSAAKDFLSETIKSAIHSNTHEIQSLKNVDETVNKHDEKRLHVPIKMKAENTINSEAIKNEFKNEKVVQAEVHNSSSAATSVASKNIRNNVHENENKPLKVAIVHNDKNMQSNQAKTEMNSNNRRSSFSSSHERRDSVQNVQKAEVYNSTSEASKNVRSNLCENSKAERDEKLIKPLKVEIVQNDKNMQKNETNTEMNTSNQSSSISSSNERRHSAHKVHIASDLQSSSKSSEQQITSNHSQDARKELSNVSKLAENTLANGFDEFSRSMVDLDDRTGWHSLRNWFFPKFTENKHSDVIKIEENEEKLELQLDASKYKPDELRVSVEHGTITVEGKHEEKAEDGHVMVSRQFIRKYSLPAGARAEDVVSNLSSEGVLVISANKSKLFKQKVEVEIQQK